MPSKISGHHKKPSIRAFSVYTFHVSFKKSISITPTKRANLLTLLGSHVQWFVRSIRFIRFAYFAALPFIRVCLSLTRQSPLHSPGTSCHARFAHTHSLRCFVRSLISLISRPPLSHASRICQVFCWLSPRLE